ncbi:hypothetical protein [Deinococcus sp. QL22]|uniref:hypothetical protein n=1 Tax=Deinococcus sp. QL22 TaxID=2939437 RepID=UPI0020176A0A|nr:hypothetical protein [Deinococcus sp. QL22]UQN10634.1 hypothetical protein M1R55_31040 [Deinococcus sp. QL22]
MKSFLGAIGAIVREISLALLGQPSRPGPTTEERRTAEVQQQLLEQRRNEPVSVGEAAGSVGAEVAKVIIGQPTVSPTLETESKPNKG